MQWPERTAVVLHRNWNILPRPLLKTFRILWGWVDTFKYRSLPFIRDNMVKEMNFSLECSTLADSNSFGPKASTELSFSSSLRCKREVAILISSWARRSWAWETARDLAWLYSFLIALKKQINKELRKSKGKKNIFMWCVHATILMQFQFSNSSSEKQLISPIPPECVAACWLL